MFSDAVTTALTKHDKSGAIDVGSAIIQPDAKGPKLCLSLERSLAGVSVQLAAFVPAWILNSTTLPLAFVSSSGEVMCLRAHLLLFYQRVFLACYSTVTIRLGCRLSKRKISQSINATLVHSVGIVFLPETLGTYMAPRVSGSCRYLAIQLLLCHFANNSVVPIVCFRLCEL